MSKVKSILSSCFRSNSRLWQDYLNSAGEPVVLYYPSAGEDLRPLVFCQRECLSYTGARVDEEYREPDLFIFSDYFPYDESPFLDRQVIYGDMNTMIGVREICEIFPVKNGYRYQFNPMHVHFEPGSATGRAVFFKAAVFSNRSSAMREVNVLYFFYENVNLLDQLFLKHRLPVDQLVWKRDGTGFGGGSVYHDFLYQIGTMLDTGYFFIWDKYQNGDEPEITEMSPCLNRKYWPQEIKSYLCEEFNLSLKKQGTLRWCIDDRMNFYKRQTVNASK